MTHTNGTLTSRRIALAGLGAGLGALAVHGQNARAQDAGDLANHPLVGTWIVMTTGGVAPQTHGPDGSFIAAFPPNYVDPSTGLTFQGPALGRWESTGERSGRFTFMQTLTGPDGVYLGTMQLSADIAVTEDGNGWAGTEGPRIISRDAANAVTFDAVVDIGPPVMATRMGATADSVVMPGVRPTEGTPTSS